jgi:hypothetical protein
MVPETQGKKEGKRKKKGKKGKKKRGKAKNALLTLRIG